MQEVVVPELHCYRCGNTWSPRFPVVKICPRCKSKLWDEPKIKIPNQGNGLGVEELLGPHRKDIRRIMRKYGATDVRIFGSVARRDANDRSDVDFLIDLGPNQKTRSSLRSLDLARELESLLGRRVDVVTESSLHWFVQPQIVAEAVPL